jgi:hypothetical protein
MEIGMRLRFIVPLAKRLKIPATRESGVESGAQSEAQSEAQSKAILNALRDARLSANELTEVVGPKEQNRGVQTNGKGAFVASPY